MKYNKETLQKREKYAFEILKAYIGTTSDGQAGTDGVQHLANSDTPKEHDERLRAIKNAIMFADEFLEVVETKNKQDYVEHIS
jgi:hypothetical protein